MTTTDDRLARIIDDYARFANSDTAERELLDSLLDDAHDDPAYHLSYTDDTDDATIAALSDYELALRFMPSIHMILSSRDD